MSLVTNLSNAFTRVATENKTLRTLLNGNSADNAALTTTAKANLVAAINELDAAIDDLAAGGSAATLDELTDVVITTAAAGHILRHSGTEWVNVDGATVYQPLDSDLTNIAALSTTTYGRAFLTLANQAGLMTLIQAASETVQGKVELATATETQTGTDTARATHPAGVKSAIDAAISTASGNYQPVDSDLTAIAGLATTTYGRTLLTLADQAALMGLVASATTTAQGKVELATTAEATAGTDTTRAITAAGLKSAIDAVNLDRLSDVVITTPGAGHILRHDGTTGFVNVDGATIYQPLDSDLTAIAGIATTAYGRGFLALADQAALKALLPTGTETATGLLELATAAEATTGTDTTRAVHPAGLKAVVDERLNALIDSAPGTLDTLNELAAALGDDPNFATSVNTALANRVRVDAAQTFTSLQQAQGRDNIGAASAADVGDTTTNFVATFEAGLV